MLKIDPTPRPRSPAARWRTLATALAAAGPTVVTGQSPAPASLETVTVVGTRLSPATAPAGPVTIIDAATIRASNGLNLSELLAGVAGVHANLPGGRGSAGEIFLRGGEPNFTAVLVDGVQVNDPTNTRGGSFDFAALNLAEVERIEILKGPLSSVYGSDALSGLINIVTPSGTETVSAAASAEVGAEDLARAGLTLGGPVGTIGRYNFQATRLVDGRSDASSGYRGETLGAKIELATPGAADLALIARHSDTRLHAFPDSSGGPSLAVLRGQDRRDATDGTLALTWSSPIGGASRLQVFASSFDHDEDTASPGVAAGVRDAIPPSVTQTDFERRNVTLFVSGSWEQLSTAVGLSLTTERGVSAGTVMLEPGFSLPTSYELSRDTTAAFAELAYSTPGGLSLAAALRGDRTETQSTEITSKIALAHELADSGVRLRLAWGKGFKLPSLFSLGHPLVGNPELQAETAETWEAGIDLGRTDNRFAAGAAVFAQRFENLIDFDLDSFMSVNRDRVDTDGVELRARYALGDALTLSGHASWLDIDVVGSDQDLRQRPERTGGAALDWAISPRASLSLGWRYVGTRLDSSVPTGDRELPSYTRLDLSLSWQVSEQTRLGAAIDNLAGRDYEDAIGFPSLGRRLRLSVQTALGSGSR
jgi:iron complex outermembrane receptor protein/vitamin B12 transporter